MSTSTYDNRISDHDAVRRSVFPAGILSTGVAMAFSYLGAHDLGEVLVMFVLQAVVAGLLFGVVVSRGLRHDSAGGRGIAMAVVGLLLVAPAFWSGLPVLLGVAAVLLGLAGRRASHGSGKAITSLALGVLCVVAYLAIYFGDLSNTGVIG